MPAGGGSSPRRSQLPALLLVAVAVLVVGGIIGAAVSSSGGGDTSSLADDEVGQEDRGEDDVTTTRAPDTSVTTPPSTTPGTPTSVEVGRWILVLGSLDKGTTSLEEAWTEASATAPGSPAVTIVDSDATPGLNGGYWVITALSYASREEAVSQCSSFGRDIGGACYPTRVGDGAR